MWLIGSLECDGQMVCPITFQIFASPFQMLSMDPLWICEINSKAVGNILCARFDESVWPADLQAPPKDAIKRVSTETFMVIDKVIMTFVFLRQTL